jgi:hypothetical protein
MLAKGIVKNMEKGNCNPEMHLVRKSSAMEQTSLGLCAILASPVEIQL